MAMPFPGAPRLFEALIATPPKTMASTLPDQRNEDADEGANDAKNEGSDGHAVARRGRRRRPLTCRDVWRHS